MLKIENIFKTFNAGTVNEKVALQGLNLHLKEGDFVTVIGGNGAGKSTMLNAITGVFGIDSGKVLIDGEDVTHLPEYKRAKFIGRVFQDPMMGTAATMQIEENLALAARRGKPRTLRIGITKAEREEYREKLKILDLGLEDRMTAKVLEATQKIVSKDNLTTMMITHNMRDAIQYGNRLIMMYDGHIVVDVSGEEKKNLTVEQLLNLFSQASGSTEVDDKLVLG